jgi:Orotidine 5'-phosphate decarboxylase / HUMPS family
MVRAPSWAADQGSDAMIDDVPSESKRIRRLLRERFTFQISVDTSNVPQGLAVAEAALKAGVTVLELGTPLLKYEGVRNVIPIFRQHFPKALLLADMKTMDGGGGEANAVYSGGGNVIDFLALAGEATARSVCATRDASREADPAIPRLAYLRPHALNEFFPRRPAHGLRAGASSTSTSGLHIRIAPNIYHILRATTIFYSAIMIACYEHVAYNCVP